MQYEVIHNNTREKYINNINGVIKSLFTLRTQKTSHTFRCSSVNAAMPHPAGEAKQVSALRGLLSKLMGRHKHQGNRAVTPVEYNLFIRITST